jgi:beta-phosphoglucomutase-like phosphatase (HAD superfamily)
MRQSIATSKPHPAGALQAAAHVNPISGSSITAHLGSLQELISYQGNELATLRTIRDLARRLAGMPQDPEQEAHPEPSIDGLQSACAKLRDQHDERRSLIDAIGIALGAP